MPAENTPVPRFAQVYITPKQALMLALGFASGLPLALTGATLSAWLKDSGLSIQTIGLSSAVAAAYSLKFLWSPLVDGISFPLLSRLLGRRRGWLLAAQLALLAAVLFMASLDPATQTPLLVLAAGLVAFLSATQDVAVDAYRVERLAPEELGPGTAMFTLGYRLGMLAASWGALRLADIYGWHVSYMAMAALMGIGLAATLCGKEPEDRCQVSGVRNDTMSSVTRHLTPVRAFVARSVVAPFADFMKRERWWLILLFIATYKLGDAFLGNMTNPFLMEIGFTKSQIADIVKLYGFTATILGTFIGGWLTTRYHTFKPLILCGLFHALTNLMFLWQARVGADPQVLMLGITLENLTGGMSSAVLVVFISGLTHREFTATQYALLSSLAAIGRTLFASASGYLVAWLGWEGFFVFAVLLALPSLLILARLRPLIQKA